MSDVSRETLAEPDPAKLTKYFPGRESIIIRYAESLATDGIIRGLIGPREVPRIWDRHIFNCVYPAERLAQGAVVADVGSGAGLPGLVWAIARPDLQITLIEPLLRRSRYLEEIVEDLGLEVRVLRSRAEDVDEVFEFVTARAVAQLGKLARWCLPLVEPGGSLLALKGSSAQDEVDEHAALLRTLGASHTSVRGYGPEDDQTLVVEVVRNRVSRETVRKS